MAMDQAERDRRRREKSAKMQEEDLRLKVRPGTKQALLDLMEWAGIEEQGEALTLMIHHVEALGHHALFRIARHEVEAHRSVARTEPLRLSARKQTGQNLRTICGWADATYSQMIEALIHGIHALGRLHAAKFLTPPRHEISISPRLALAFDRKSMLMLQQDPGDEIVPPGQNMEGAGGIEPPRHCPDTSATRPTLRNLENRSLPAPSRPIQMLL